MYFIVKRSFFCRLSINFKKLRSHRKSSKPSAVPIFFHFVADKEEKKLVWLAHSAFLFMCVCLTVTGDGWRFNEIVEIDNWMNCFFHLLFADFAFAKFSNYIQYVCRVVTNPFTAWIDLIWLFRFSSFIRIKVQPNKFRTIIFFVFFSFCVVCHVGRITIHENQIFILFFEHLFDVWWKMFVIKMFRFIGWMKLKVNGRATSHERIECTSILINWFRQKSEINNEFVHCFQFLLWNGMFSIEGRNHIKKLFVSGKFEMVISFVGAVVVSILFGQRNQTSVSIKRVYENINLWTE